MKEYLPAIGLAALAAAFLVASYSYTPQARAFPSAVGWVTLVLVALDIVSRTGTPVGAALRQRLNPITTGASEDPAPFGRQLGAALWLAVFGVALVLTGVMYAVPVYVFASLRFQGRRPWLTCLWIAVAVTGCLWLLFALLLRLELYRGYFFGGA